MNWHKLPFSHGIEVENHIVNEKGEVVTGNTLVETWNELFSKAGGLLRSEVANAPKLIKEKAVKIETNVEVKRQDKRLTYHAVIYRLKQSKITTYSFGPDPNISQITWLLELVTPPCEYLEELDWWITTLYKISKLPEGLSLLPIGINPAEKTFRSGLSCGEHHHLGIQNSLISSVYNILRAYVPHLICLTASSPLLDFSPTGSVKISTNSKGYSRVIAKNCTRSLRLKFNTTQLGPNSTSYLPHLSERTTRSDFSAYVNKPPPDDRYVDIYPFTEHGTIELRFFDALFSNSLRLAVVAILQALALKAQRFREQNTAIPDVGADSLFENRRKAIDIGLLGRFQISESSTPNPGDPFWRFYHWDPETGQPHAKLFQAVRSMMFFIKEELLELEFLPIVNRVLAFLWGTEEPEKLAPPFSLSEEILRRAIKRSQSKTELIRSFYFPGDSYLAKGTKLSSSAKEFLLAEPAEPVLASIQPKKRITQVVPIPTPKKAKKKRKRTKKVSQGILATEKEEDQEKAREKPSKPKKRKEKKKKERKKKKDRKKTQDTTKPDDEGMASEPLSSPPLVSVSEKEREPTQIPIPDITATDRGFRDSTIAQAMKKRKGKLPAKAESLPVTEKELSKKDEVRFVDPRPKKVVLEIPKKIQSGVQFWIPKVEWAKKDLDLENFERGRFEVIVRMKAGEKTKEFTGSWESIHPTTNYPLIALPVMVDPTSIISDKIKLQIYVEATYEHQLLFQESQTRKLKKISVPMMRIAKVAYKHLHGLTKASYFLESDAKDKGQLETRIVSPYLDQLLIEERIEFADKQSLKLEREVYIPHTVLERSYWLVTSIKTKNAQNTSYRRVVPPQTRLVDFEVNIAPCGGKKDPYSKIDVEASVKFRTGLRQPTIRLMRLDSVGKPQTLAELGIKNTVEYGSTILLAKKKWKPPKGLLKAEMAIEVEDKFGLLQSDLIASSKAILLRQ